LKCFNQQIAEYRPKVNTDVAIDLKVIKASRKSQRSESELSVYNKLSVVENWIYEHEPVGHASRPGAWIYGGNSSVSLLLQEL
jgi:hypothetical protein